MTKGYNFKFQHHILMIIGIALFVFSGCKNKPEHIFLPSDFKDVMLFDTGSYWIYKEVGGFEEDSIRVIKNDEITTNIGSNERKPTYIKHEFISQYNGLNTKYSQRSTSIALILLSTTPTDASENATIIARESSSGLLTDILIYPFQKGLIHRNSDFNEDERIDSILAELLVGNVKYNNVIKYYSPHSYFFFNQPTFNYFVHGIGIVRIDYLKSGEIWELQRYRVELL
ncbi:MAG: hypothetical protein KG003_14085 [Bacteroidetes bacterium]|nr:hypothetical protein [Bacteroidota bacterium]